MQQAGETQQKFLTGKRFESFESFKKFIREMFIEGSGIDPEIFDACVEFHEDLEFDYGGEVDTPIHNELEWHFTRFGRQANEPTYAAFLKNEDGKTWQVIVSTWDEEKQRPYKYFAPKGVGDKAFLPPVPPSIRKRISQRYGIQVPLEGSFWDCVEDTDITRIVTEGAKKALSLLSLGYVAIALYGCRCGAKKDESGNTIAPYLIDDLKRFASPDSRWLDAMDKDKSHKAQLSVRAGKKNRKTALTSLGCFVGDINWKHEQGKGVDDFVKNNGSSAFDAEYQKAIAKLEKIVKSDSAPEPTGAISRNKQHLNLLEVHWGHRLRFNERTLKPELDGNPINFDTLSIEIATQFDVDVTKEKAFEIVLFLSQRNRYHPVKEYLERVATEYPDQNSKILDDMATRYFGSDEPIHNAMIRKQMIGAARRIYEPGCQHDTALVLQGKQGKQKSSFWRTLAVNQDWFDDSVTSGNNDKDDRLKLRQYWIIELAEMESVFRRKEVAGFRSFMTTKCDNLRVPYGRSVEPFPRASVFVGSVNPDDFLVDPEGSRRFWVIPVRVDSIPIDLLKQELDELWAAAVHAYRRGEQHWLTPEEEEQNALLNRNYETQDSWQEVIDNYLAGRTEASVTDILSNCLKIEIGKHDKASQMRVTGCLKKGGWEKGVRKTSKGQKIQAWKPIPLKVCPEVCPPSNPDAASFTANTLKKVCPEVCPPSNPDAASFTEEVDIPLVKNPKLSNDFQTTPLDGSIGYVSQDTISGRQLEITESLEKGMQGMSTFPRTLTDKGLEGDIPSGHTFEGMSFEQENSFIRMESPVNYKGEQVVVVGFRRQEPRVEVQYPSGSKTFARTKDLTHWKID